MVDKVDGITSLLYVIFFIFKLKYLDWLEISRKPFEFAFGKLKNIYLYGRNINQILKFKNIGFNTWFITWLA